VVPGALPRRWCTAPLPSQFTVTSTVASRSGRRHPLAVAEGLTFDELFIAEVGGSGEIRALRALESVLFRRRTRYDRDVVEQAAALHERLIQNQPFVDPDKWVALP
jgi:hypothetical protein